MQGRQCTGIQEGIRQGDLPEGRRYAVAQEYAGDRFAQATDDRVVLGRDDQAARLAGFGQDGRLVQGFDCLLYTSDAADE